MRYSSIIQARVHLNIPRPEQTLPPGIGIFMRAGNELFVARTESGVWPPDTLAGGVVVTDGDEVKQEWIGLALVEALPVIARGEVNSVTLPALPESIAFTRDLEATVSGLNALTYTSMPLALKIQLVLLPGDEAWSVHSRLPSEPAPGRRRRGQ